MAFVYILECADKTYYTGAAKNFQKRLADHQNAKGAKYTKSRLPVKAVYLEYLPSYSEALKREYEIKKLSKPKKGELIYG